MVVDIITFVDDNFKRAVKYAHSISANDVTCGDVRSITDLNVPSSEITDMREIQYFTGLTSLDCFGNNLTTLDLRQNTALTILRCHNNPQL